MSTDNLQVRDKAGRVRLPIASINDLPIAESERRYRWPLDGIGRALSLSPRLGGEVLGRRAFGLGRRYLAVKHGPPVSVPQMLGRRRRPCRHSCETVPAPQPPLAIDQPLAGREAGLQRATLVGALHPAGLCEAPSGDHEDGRVPKPRS